MSELEDTADDLAAKIAKKIEKRDEHRQKVKNILGLDSVIEYHPAVRNDRPYCNLLTNIVDELVEIAQGGGHPKWTQQVINGIRTVDRPDYHFAAQAFYRLANYAAMRRNKTRDVASVRKSVKLFYRALELHDKEPDPKLLGDIFIELAKACKNAGHVSPSNEREYVCNYGEAVEKRFSVLEKDKQALYILQTTEELLRNSDKNCRSREFLQKYANIMRFILARYEQMGENSSKAKQYYTDLMTRLNSLK